MAIKQTTDGIKIWARRNTKEQITNWIMWLVGTATFMYCWQGISAETDWDFSGMLLKLQLILARAQCRPNGIISPAFGSPYGTP